MNDNANVEVASHTPHSHNSNHLQTHKAMNTDYIPVSAIGLVGAPYEADICTCPRCNGRGEWYVLWNDEEEALELSPEQYSTLPAEQQQYYDHEQCPLCEGAGEIDQRFIKH